MRYYCFIFCFVLHSFIGVCQSYVNTLANKSDFEKLSGLPLSDKYGHVSSVKVVYDVEKQALYFINSHYYTYHHEFCNELANRDISLEVFNELNYSDFAHREYLLANINYYKSLDTYAMELASVDLMPVNQIISFYHYISKASFVGEKLKFLLNNTRLQKAQGVLQKEIPVINPSEIYLNLSFQAISKNKNEGILRFIKDIEQEKENLNPKDIIVIDKTPLFLPTVAGIIITEFQTPLSHLTILGQNRKIPICAYKLAFSDSSLRKLENQRVLFTVKSDTFQIKPSDKEGLKNNKQKEIILKADLSTDTLIPIQYLGRNSTQCVGNKASNLGILYSISKKADFKVPESAFGIPFSFYYAHSKKCGADRYINRLTSLSDLTKNKDSVKYYLQQIRTLILDTPLDSTLLMMVKNKIKLSGKDSILRFRSSTNAEDAKGFSGAGLYESHTGILNNKKKSIERAIKRVWASLWLYEAFAERQYYGINQQSVYMGILVHRAFPDEGVNGVAITKNLYRTDSYGFVVNAQLGDEKVVKPRSGIICDQFVCYPDNSNELYYNKNSTDIINISNLNQGQLVMTESEIKKLANQLEIIKKYFRNHSISSKSYLDFALDIEFKLDGAERQLYFKQVRYYND